MPPTAFVDALTRLYEATNGSHWENNTNWLSGEPCTDGWHGVTCCLKGRTLKNKDSRECRRLPGDVEFAPGDVFPGGCRSGSVTGTSDDLAQCSIVRLDLPGNRLDGSLPWDDMDVFELRHLVVLDLGSDATDATALKGSLPDGLGNFTSLEKLVLSHNRLEGGLPSQLADIAARGTLETLDLENNTFDYDDSEKNELDKLIEQCRRVAPVIDCEGLPNSGVCSAFGDRRDTSAYYMVSLTNKDECVKCRGVREPAIAIAVAGSLMLVGLVSYVWFIQTHPESLTKVISTASILISHVQTLSIIMNLRLSWPPSAEAVTSAMVVNIFELETLRPECLVGEENEDFHFALSLHVLRAFMLLAMLVSLNAVRMLVESPRTCVNCPGPAAKWADRLEFLETVVFQVQFSSAWRVIFDLTLQMFSVSGESGVRITSILGGVTAVLLAIVEIVIPVKLLQKVRIIMDRNREAEAAAALGLDKIGIDLNRLSVCGAAGNVTAEQAHRMSVCIAGKRGSHAASVVEELEAAVEAPSTLAAGGAGGGCRRRSVDGRGSLRGSIRCSVRGSLASVDERRAGSTVSNSPQSPGSSARCSGRSGRSGRRSIDGGSLREGTELRSVAEHADESAADDEIDDDDDDATAGPNGADGIGDEGERLEWRMRYITKRFDKRAPNWQFYIWGRQLALTLLTFVPDIADEVCLSDADRPGCKNGGISGGALDAVVWSHAILALLVLAVSWRLHWINQPYTFAFQNWLETWLFFAGVAVIALGTAYTFASERASVTVEALLLLVLVGSIVCAAAYLTWNYRKARLELRSALERQISQLLRKARSSQHIVRLNSRSRSNLLRPVDQNEGAGGAGRKGPAWRRLCRRSVRGSAVGIVSTTSIGIDAIADCHADHAAAAGEGSANPRDGAGASSSAELPRRSSSLMRRKYEERMSRARGRSSVARGSGWVSRRDEAAARRESAAATAGCKRAQAQTIGGFRTTMGELTQHVKPPAPPAAPPPDDVDGGGGDGGGGGGGGASPGGAPAYVDEEARDEMLSEWCRTKSQWTTYRCTAAARKASAACAKRGGDARVTDLLEIMMEGATSAPPPPLESPRVAPQPASLEVKLALILTRIDLEPAGEEETPAATAQRALEAIGLEVDGSVGTKVDKLMLHLDLYDEAGRPAPAPAPAAAAAAAAAPASSQDGASESAAAAAASSSSSSSSSPAQGDDEATAAAEAAPEAAPAPPPKVEWLGCALPLGCGVHGRPAPHPGATGGDAPQAAAASEQEASTAKWLEEQQQPQQSQAAAAGDASEGGATLEASATPLPVGEAAKGTSMMRLPRRLSLRRSCSRIGSPRTLGAAAGCTTVPTFGKAPSSSGASPTPRSPASGRRSLEPTTPEARPMSIKERMRFFEQQAAAASR